MFEPEVQSVKADARSRSMRSLFQGALAAALVAVVATIGDYLVPGVEIHWPTLALLGLSAALSAGAAYIQRRSGM